MEPSGPAPTVAGRALARGTDWSRHPLGPAHRWPASVRQALRLVTDLPGPALLLVGDERFTFGNDAALPLLGRREEALGAPGRQADQRSAGSPRWHLRACGRLMLR